MNLEMATFRFENCKGCVGNYPCNNQTYKKITIGGKLGLLNALMELKPDSIQRLS